MQPYEVGENHPLLPVRQQSKAARKWNLEPNGIGANPPRPPITSLALGLPDAVMLMVQGVDLCKALTQCAC